MVKMAVKQGRPPMRQDPVRVEEIHEEEIRPKKTRTRKGGNVNALYVSPDLIPAGMDYQWVTDSVLGSPAIHTRMSFEANGWEAVQASRHDGLFMPRGFQGEINVGGLVLMERPMELTIEAREEERAAARLPRQNQERALRGGDIPGVTLDTQHPSARNNTFVRSTMEQGIPVPKD